MRITLKRTSVKAQERPDREFINSGSLKREQHLREHAAMLSTGITLYKQQQEFLRHERKIREYQEQAPCMKPVKRKAGYVKAQEHIFPSPSFSLR